MAFSDVNRCHNCGHIWLEDDRMLKDPARCPRCGTRRGENPEHKKGES